MTPPLGAPCGTPKLIQKLKVANDTPRGILLSLYTLLVDSLKVGCYLCLSFPSYFLNIQVN
jgi:hypothetical protein